MTNCQIPMTKSQIPIGHFPSASSGHRVLCTLRGDPFNCALGLSSGRRLRTGPSTAPRPERDEGLRTGLRGSLSVKHRFIGHWSLIICHSTLGFER